MVDRLRRALSSGFLRGVAVLASGTLLAQALPILITPFLTRLYSPHDFGQLGLYASFLSIAIPLGSLQYSKALVSARTEREAEVLFDVCMVLVPITSILLTLVLGVLTWQNWLGFGYLPLWALIPCMLSLVWSSLFMNYRFWTLRYGRFKVISKATVWQSLLRSLSSIALGIVNTGGVGLMLSDAVGRGAGLGGLRRASTEIRFTNPLSIERQELKDVLNRYRRFPLISAPSMLINSMALTLPVPLIAMWFGTNDSGQFSLASRIMLLPMTIVGAAVGDVFHNKLADVARKSPSQARTVFLRVSGVMSLLAVAMASVVLLMPLSLWTTLLGSEWRLAGEMTRALVPWVAAQTIVSPVSQVVPVYQRHELKLVYDCFSLAAVIAVTAFGQSQAWDALHVVSLLGVSQALAYGFYFVLLYLAIPAKAN